MKVSVGSSLEQLKIISREEDGGWNRVPVSLEVIGIKELAKALVRFLSNLPAKGC